MPNNFVWSNFIDKNGIIWAGTNKGIAKIDALSPISYWSAKNGLEGIIEDVIRYKEIVYVCTHTGIFYLKDGEAHKLSGFSQNEQCWSFATYATAKNDTLLLACTQTGIYQIDNFNLKKLFTRTHCFQLLPSETDKTLLFTANGDGVGAIRYNNGKWIDLGTISGISDNVRGMIEDENNTLWVGTFRNGFIRISIDKENINKPKSIEYFNTKHGLKSLTNCLPYQYNTSIAFVADDGIYKFNELNKQIKL